MSASTAVTSPLAAPTTKKPTRSRSTRTQKSPTSGILKSPPKRLSTARKSASPPAKQTTNSPRSRKAVTKPAKGRQRLSALLEQFMDRPDTDKITIRELLGDLGTSGFGISLALFSIPEVLPIPIPGATAAVCLPTSVISVQMMAGKDRVILPERLLDREISARNFKRAARAVLPALKKIEKFSRPRGDLAKSRTARRLIGVIVFFLMLTIALPIPGTNMPPAIAIFIIAIGLIESDERLLAAGIALGLLSIALIGGGTLALLLALL